MKAKPFLDIISYLAYFYQLSLISSLFGQEEGEIEIASERLRLSYVDPIRCVELLKLYGVNVGSPNQAVDRTKLPVVVIMPRN